MLVNLGLLFDIYFNVCSYMGSNEQLFRMAGSLGLWLGS